LFYISLVINKYISIIRQWFIFELIALSYLHRNSVGTITQLFILTLQVVGFVGS